MIKRYEKFRFCQRPYDRGLIREQYDDFAILKFPEALEAICVTLTRAAQREEATLFNTEDEIIQLFTQLRARRKSGKCLYQRFQMQTGNKMRNLAVPIPPLKRLLAAYVLPFIKQLPVHSACHGAEPGWTPLKSIASHMPMGCSLSFDLKDAFMEMNAENVYLTFREAFSEHPRAVREAISSVLTTLTTVPYDTYSRGLPQGAPHSCALFNRVLFGLDDVLQEAARVRGLHVSRWIDDIVVSSPKVLPLEELLGAAALVKEYMALAPNKLYYQTCDRPIFLLGQRIEANHIAHNSAEQRSQEKVAPLNYDEWFTEYDQQFKGKRRYKFWGELDVLKYCEDKRMSLQQKCI